MFQTAEPMFKVIQVICTGITWWAIWLPISLTVTVSLKIFLFKDIITHTHIRLTALCLGLPGWAGTRKGKPTWILLKQETVSGSGISWAICKSAHRSRQITMPAPHCSVFYRPDALPAAQTTASKHWRQKMTTSFTCFQFRMKDNKYSNSPVYGLSDCVKNYFKLID